MKKLLFVMSLVAVFSLAASAKTPSTTYNFYFLTANGDPYCDGMVLKNYGNPQTLVDGFHFDVFCFLELGIADISVPVNGFLAPVASNYQYSGSGNVMVVGVPDGCTRGMRGNHNLSRPARYIRFQLPLSVLSSDCLPDQSHNEHLDALGVWWWDGRVCGELWDI